MNISFLVKDPEAGIRAHTAVSEVPCCAGLRLHTAISFTQLWEATEVAGAGATPPYWSIPWVGGQALARYLLAYPEAVADRRVLDLGSGGGICAIAAARAGAADVQAFDPDPMARAALAANASLNGVRIAALTGDPVEGEDGGEWDVILAADLWYERFLARRITTWLREQAMIDTRAGRRVLLGDPGRAYFPRHGVRALQWFETVDVADTEAGATVRSAVWAFTTHARPRTL